MRLEQLVPSQVYANKPGASVGLPFDAVYEAGRERAKTLAAEDRTMRLSRFFYAGEAPVSPSTLPVAQSSIASADIFREVGSTRQYAFTEGAFRNLADAVGPSNGARIGFHSYLRACDPKLALLNLNAWLQKNGDREGYIRTVRPFGLDVVRSVHSTKYVAIDDFDLLSILSEIEDITQGATLQGFSFGDESSFIKITWPAARQEVRPGDIVQAGVVVSNSEIGRRAVRVEPLVYRLLCGNGLIQPREGGDGSWYIRHVGSPQRVRNAVSEAIAAALPAARQLAERFRAAVHEAIDRPVETLQALAQQENLTDEMVAAAIDELLGTTQGTPTRFDFVNAITGAGRRLEDPDTRYDLERLGAKYLSVPLPIPVRMAA